jgi:hypothetical protein
MSRTSTPKLQSLTQPRVKPPRQRSTTPPRQLLICTTLNRNAKPRLQFSILQPALLPGTTPSRQLSITPLFTLLPPTTPKLRSFTLCWATTPLKKPNITPQTLLQLTTWRFLNARAEISSWFYLDTSVVFMVIGHWELIVDLDWENKISNVGNSFLRLGSNFKPINVAAVYWCWTSSRSVSYVVICLLCFGSDYCLNRSAYRFVLVIRREVSRESYERNLQLLIFANLISKRQLADLCIMKDLKVEEIP